MSHATVMVAISPEQLTEANGNIEAAVHFQMLPFDENGEWFRDGSRWDWWQIGGRYSGRLLGKDICQRKELTDEAIEVYKVKTAKKLWADYQTDLNEKRKGQMDNFIRSYVYGIEEGDTEETIIEKFKRNKISGYAFLRDRRWHENERLGFFGAPAKTECEVNHGHEGTCLHKNEELNARVITFNYNEEGWTERYFDKFIKDLPEDTYIVCVDYHV